MSEHKQTDIAGKAIHSLVVDDDQFMLEFIGDMLRDLGVKEVTTATDGTQALAALDARDAIPDG